MMFLSEVHASNESALSERPVLQTWEDLGYSWQEGGSEYTLPQKHSPCVLLLPLSGDL